MLIGWVGEGGGKQASVVEGGIFMNRLMMGVMKMMGYDDDASGLCEEKRVEKAEGTGGRSDARGGGRSDRVGRNRKDEVDRLKQMISTD